MNVEELRNYLLDHSLIKGDSIEILPLSGGVSSLIYLVKDGEREFVVKKALHKLRVKEDWHADVERNTTEQKFIQYVANFLPRSVPKILHSDPEAGLFTMEYFCSDFKTWKTLLLKGNVKKDHTTQAAQILATIHQRSWKDTRAKNNFDTTKNFHQLRLEPYLINTAKKHAPLQELFLKEVDRLSNTRLCLVHGDFSPKNILVGPGRMILLDCEVAWYGDPSFDVALFLNHLLLKSLYHSPYYEDFVQNATIFKTEYKTLLGTYYTTEKLESSICHLLPMLLLARVDGKSPVEYLDSEKKKNLIRKFSTKCLLNKVDRLEPLLKNWSDELNNFCNQMT